MFQGFNESTIMYYKAIHKENSKKVYQDNEQLYLKGVKFSNESSASTHICIFPSR